MFGNKADNLILLSGDGFNVPQFYIVNDKKEIVYGKSFESDQYSIRSSANVEDGEKKSFAGQFSTHLYVDKKNIDDIDRSKFINVMYILLLNRRYCNERSLPLKNIPFG